MQIGKAINRLLVIGLLISIGAISGFAQQAANAQSAANGTTAAGVEVTTLKQQLAVQQKQIEALQSAVNAMKQKLDQTDSPSSGATGQIGSVDEVASTSPVVPKSMAKVDHASDTLAVAGTPGVPAANGAGQSKVEQKLSDLAYGKIKIGGTFYGDWAYYYHTGFGPQFMTQLNQEGPGNDGFNSFDVTRTYLNIFYTPTEAVTLRLTPNIYRQVDVSSAIADGKGAGIASSSNGNLGFRLKYAYVDFNSIFKGSDALKKDKLTVGQTTQPLTDWEEGLYGYRYVNLTPWNYLSLSSTYTGVTLHGPIEHNGKEYLDYHIGVFNTASFHAIEQNDKKQVMARVTWYPMGTTSDRTGFGLTAFDDYGYSTKTPDTRSVPLYRLALIAHYQSHSKAYLIAAEYDLGHNAFSTGNLFSGAGPADQFGLGPSSYATFSALSSALLAGEHTRQQGYDVFGHAKLGKSPFAVFGSYQYFQPNTNISGTNPLDLEHFVAGVSYHYNEHFDIAFDSQNLRYANSQFTMSNSQIATFSSSLATSNPNGIPNAVPKNSNAFFVNLLFNY
jgi:hypothetical protein